MAVDELNALVAVNAPKTASGWRAFSVVYEGPDSVALRSIGTHDYLTPASDGSGFGATVAQEPGPSETFHWTWVDKAKGTFTLTAPNGKALSAPAAKPILADDGAGRTLTLTLR